MDLFQLEGYNCISQSFNPLCSSHGGLVTYVDSEYSASVIESFNDSTVWEGLFSSVHDPSLVKDIVVGISIGRPKIITTEVTLTLLLENWNQYLLGLVTLEPRFF